MTIAQLRAQLELFLSDLLGTFTVPGMPTPIPALYVGDPPSDWTVAGVECRVSPDPDFEHTALYGPESNLAETYLVRLIAHGPGALAPAVRRVTSHFRVSTTTTIPGNEELGILNQVLIRIPK